MQQEYRDWWLPLTLLIATGAFAAPSSVCPASDTILPCRCSSIGDDTQIWCSYSNLASVMAAIQRLGPTLQSTVDEMILEGNNLPSLPGRSFQGLQIVRLMLRDNALERVTSNWLATLEPSLQELFITEPRMRTIPPDILDNLDRLEAVTLQTGLMKRAPNIARLPQLRYIHIQSPILSELSPDNFVNLPNLEQLNIVGSPLLNKLEVGFHRELPKLDLLNFSNCSISWLHPNTFGNLNNLRELSLMWNRIADAGVVGRACRELRSLQIIRLDNNFIDRLLEGSFVDLPSLRELSLSGNMISEIHSGAFRNTPSLKILDLSKNLLRRVNSAAFLYPSGSSLEELWLVDNQLYQVNELRTLFNSLPRLRFLDMSKNQMEELPFDVLRGHPTLERLHLDENRIKRLPKKALSGMTALRELRLRNNSISEYPDSAAWNLPALKGLDLAQNKIRRLDGRLMTYLPSLRRLDLSENFIDTVLPDTFMGNLNLETINLSKNFITSFHALTFSHLPKLYELDASYNRLREMIQGLPNDIEYLRLGQNQIFTLPAPPAQLNLPQLRLLDMNGNALQVVQQDTFAFMSKLQWLYLNENLIQAVEHGSLNGLSRLEVLNLKNNRLRDVSSDYLKGLKGLKEINLQGNYLEIISRGILEYSPKLETVKLGNNKITDIHPGAFSNARELQELNITHNYLDRFPEALQGLKMLRSLDISHNIMRSIQTYLFESLPSLTELHMESNKLYDLSPNIFNDLQKLEYLNLANNELENLSPRSISSLPSLIALGLGGNRLTEIQDDTFVDLPELQTLDLQSNHLQRLSERAFVNIPHLTTLNLSHNLLLDVDKAGFRELRSLEVLDLSDNKVAFIDSSHFKGMDWLVDLRMDNNIICYIHGAPFNDLPRLRVLSLRHNRMTTVTEPAFQQLRNNIAVLDVDGNPLSCSCRMLWLQTWLKDTTAPGPRCSDGSLFRDARLSRVDCAHSRTVEPVVPGCEESQNPKSSSQHAASFYTPTNVTLPHSMSLKVPELGESEYVYDEYMEYEEVNGTDAMDATPTFVPVDVTAGEMKDSPHLIAGDTPTIYAQQKPPKLNLTNPGLGYHDLKKAQQLQTPHGASSYNGLSFFGIPLPSFGSIWKGRSTEPSFTSKRGKVQPVNPTSRNRAQNFVTLGPPDKTEPKSEFPSDRFSSYVKPTSFESGFKPILDRTPEQTPFPDGANVVSQTASPPEKGSENPNAPLNLPTLHEPHLRLEADEQSVRIPADDLPSATLPREHRTEVEKPQWQTPKDESTWLTPDEAIANMKVPEGPVLKEEETSIWDESKISLTELEIPKEISRDSRHPGKVEPVNINMKELVTESSKPDIDIGPLNDESINEAPEYANHATRSQHLSQEVPLDRNIEIPLENELPETTVNKYMNNEASDDWYFQNYNKTNLQPFIERSFEYNSGRSKELSSQLILTAALIFFMV